MSFTAGQLVERIEALSPYRPAEGTVDRIVIGRSETVVRGVVSTFIASVEILQEAVARDANFVLTHEPTFYNHHDHLNGWQDDAVVKAKLALIEKHGLVVYRYHDMPHRIRPDMIMTGMTRRLGWKDVERDATDRPLVRIAPMPLGQLVRYMKERLGGQTMRYVGDANQMCSTIGFRVGSPGPDAQFPLLRDEKVDVMTIGECSEWSTGGYVRDAIAQGRKVGLILMGHLNSEDAGAAWISQWISEKLGIKIEHLVEKDPFVAV